MTQADIPSIKCTLEPAPRFNDQAKNGAATTQDLEAIRKWCRDCQTHVRQLTDALRVDASADITQAASLQTDLGSLEEDVAKANTDSAAIQAKLAAIQTSFAALRTAFDGLQAAALTSANLTTLQDAIAADEAAIAALQTSRTADEANITTLQGQVSALQSNQAADEANIASLQASRTADEGNISSLQSSRSADEANITTLQGQVSTLQSNQTTDEANISSLQSSRSADEANITSLLASRTTDEADIASLKTSRTADEGNISSLLASRTTDEGNISTLQSSVSSLLASRTTDEADISSLKTSRTTDEANITSLLASRTTDEADISSLKTSRTTDEADIASLQASRTADEASITSLLSSRTTDETDIAGLKTSRTADEASVTALQGLHGRNVLQSATTYYVATTGNDSNSGTDVSHPFLTIQKAVNVFMAFDQGNALTHTIQLADGTYSEQVIVSNLVASGLSLLIITGNAGTPANVVVDGGSGGTCFTVNSCYAQVRVQNLKVQNSGSGGQLLNCTNHSFLAYSNLIFGTTSTGGYHIVCQSGSKISCVGNYTIAAGAAAHWSGLQLGVIACQGRTITITGTPAFATAFALGTTTADLEVNGNTFSGSATGVRYTATTNSIINSAGGGATYLPGNASGTTATGGQYV